MAAEELKEGNSKLLVVVSFADTTFNEVTEQQHLDGERFAAVARLGSLPNIGPPPCIIKVPSLLLSEFARVSAWSSWGLLLLLDRAHTNLGNVANAILLVDCSSSSCL
jgi:hypothetical protein